MTPRLIAAVLLVGSACGGDDGGWYPIDPGGGGGGGVTLVDAGDVSGDGSAMISGRVCLLGDPRELTTCSIIGADGLTVALGSKTATTAANGSFVIDRPADGNPVWRVSGAGIESSAQPLASGTTIPAINSVIYDDMLAATNAVVLGGNGAIIARIANSGVPVAGITAVATPQPDSAVYYDGTSSIDWEVDQTGGAGIVWIPSLQTGTASLALDTGTAQATRTNIQVFADTITFVYSAPP